MSKSIPFEHHQPSFYPTIQSLEASGLHGTELGMELAFATFESAAAGHETKLHYELQSPVLRALQDLANLAHRGLPTASGVYTK